MRQVAVDIKRLIGVEAEVDVRKTEDELVDVILIEQQTVEVVLTKHYKKVED